MHEGAGDIAIFSKCPILLFYDYFNNLIILTYRK
jgi:hypothetical protein